MIIFDKLAWVPKNEFSENEISELRSRLTCVPRFSSFSGDNEVSEEPTPIYQYQEKKDTLGIPLSFARDWAKQKNAEMKYCLSTGKDISESVRKLPDPFHEKAVVGQDKFFSDMYEATKKRVAFLAKAPTGSGKTVTVLNTIGKLKRTSLVVVTTNVLAEQWKKEAMLHLGMDASEIGVIGGGKEEWEGKSLVIAVVHNLCMKDFGKSFYHYFGIVVWDEAHRLGAKYFSQSIKLFPARYRIAVTATPSRKDGCMSVVLDYFGKVRVQHDGEAIHCIVVPYSFYYTKRQSATLNTLSDKLPILLKLVSLNARRNEGISELIYRGYTNNRNILVISNRIEHLRELQILLVRKGVKMENIGMFNGGVSSDPIKGVKRADRKTKKEKLEEIKTNPQFKIILATYTMMKEGVDIPRLDMGIDVIPRAESVQTVGRIRRPVKGKPVPLWYTIIDKGITRLERLADSRLNDIEKEGNVTIKKERDL